MATPSSTSPSSSTPSSGDGRVVLGQLCMKGDHEALREFLRRGEEEHDNHPSIDLTASVPWTDRDGKALESSPVFICIDYGHTDCVKVLVESNADLLNVHDDNDYTPAQWAAWKGYVPILQLLIDHGAIIDQHTLDMAQEQDDHRDDDGNVGAGAGAGAAETPEVVDLVRRYMDPYAALDGDEDEIMMKACREGDVSKVTSMLHGGYDCDKWKTLEDGKYQLFSPMHMAVKRGHFDIVQLFMDTGVQFELGQDEQQQQQQQGGGGTGGEDAKPPSPVQEEVVEEEEAGRP